jgi:hypothetical protein
MKTLSIAFLVVFISAWLYGLMTPGYQFMPPFWKPEERVNWNPTPIFWALSLISLVYLLLKNKQL